VDEQRVYRIDEDLSDEWLDSFITGGLEAIDA
jgi:hypothetical protein